MLSFSFEAMGARKIFSKVAQNDFFKIFYLNKIVRDSYLSLKNFESKLTIKYLTRIMFVGFCARFTLL